MNNKTNFLKDTEVIQSLNKKISSFIKSINANGFYKINGKENLIEQLSDKITEIKYDSNDLSFRIEEDLPLIIPKINKSFNISFADFKKQIEIKNIFLKKSNNHIIVFGENIKKKKIIHFAYYFLFLMSMEKVEIRNKYKSFTLNSKIVVKNEFGVVTSFEKGLDINIDLKGNPTYYFEFEEGQRLVIIV